MRGWAVGDRGHEGANPGITTCPVLDGPRATHHPSSSHTAFSPRATQPALYHTPSCHRDFAHASHNAWDPFPSSPSCLILRSPLLEGMLSLTPRDQARLPKGAWRTSCPPPQGSHPVVSPPLNEDSMGPGTEGLFAHSLAPVPGADSSPQ